MPIRWQEPPAPKQPSFRDPTFTRGLKEHLIGRGFSGSDIEAAIGKRADLEYQTEAIKGGLPIEQIPQGERARAFVRAREAGFEPPKEEEKDPLAPQKRVALGALNLLEKRFGRGAIANIGTGKDLSFAGTGGNIARLKGRVKQAAVAVGHDPKLREDIKIFQQAFSTFLPTFTQAFGSGTPQEAEATRLIENAPGPGSSDREAKAWFSDVKLLLGGLPEKPPVDLGGVPKVPTDLGERPPTLPGEQPPALGMPEAGITPPGGEVPTLDLTVGAREPPPLSELPSHILPSAKRQVQSTLDMLLHPIQTAKGLVTLAGGVGEVLPGGALVTEAKEAMGIPSQRPAVDAVADFYMQRYGSLDAAQTTVVEDPVGVLLDISTVLSLGGAAVGEIGKAQQISKLAKVGEITAKTGGLLDPLEVGLKGIQKVNTQVGKLGIKGLNKVDDIATDLPLRGIKVSPTKQADFAEITGKTMPTFIDEFKLGADPIGKADNLLDVKQARFDEIALRTDVMVDNSEVVRAFDSRINELTTGLNRADPSLQRTAAQLEEFKNGFVAAQGEVGTSSLEDLTTIRRRIDKSVKTKKAWLTDPDTAAASVQTRRVYQDTIVDVAEGAVAQGKELRQLGTDLHDIHTFLDYTKRTAAVPAKGRLMPFLRGAYMGGGVATGNIPALIAGIVFEKLATNPRALSIASKSIKKGTGVARKLGKVPGEALEVGIKARGRAREVGLPLIPPQLGEIP